MPDATAPRPNLNTYWVVPRKFLAGEYPGDEDPGKAREKINRFFEVGVRHFVGADSIFEKILRFCEGKKLRHVAERPTFPQNFFTQDHSKNSRG